MFSHKYDLYKETIEVLFWMLNILTAIIGISILYCFKKLRETNDTKKLYGRLLSIKIGRIVVSYTYAGIIRFSGSMIFGDRNSIVLINTIAQVIYYLSIYLPVPIYVLIIIKEKLNYNWMVIGSLASFKLFIVKFIILKIRTSMLTSAAIFSQKYPILAVYTDSQVLYMLSNYFWIIGIIVMVRMFKQNNKTNEEVLEE